MRFLSLAEVLRLHSDLIAVSGGASGVRDLARLESALAQPMATFDGADLYPTLLDKAAALGFALIQGHPFVDPWKSFSFSMVTKSLLTLTFRSKPFLPLPPEPRLEYSFTTGSYNTLNTWRANSRPDLDSQP